MTKGELLKLLTDEAKRYRGDALDSVERNRHMNALSRNDLARLKKDKKLVQRLIDALLVDFINGIGTSQGIDYSLYAKHLNVRDD